MSDALADGASTPDSVAATGEREQAVDTAGSGDRGTSDSVAATGERVDADQASPESREVLAPRAFGDRLTAMANELIAPLLCTTPAYGAPGHAHCAACCYGTGVIIQDEVDQAVYEAAQALHRAASAAYDVVFSGRPTKEAGS